MNFNWLNQVPYIDPKEELSKKKEIKNRLKELKKHLKTDFYKNKLFYKKISPGCRICGNGDWSCLRINGLCSANCFFCPQDRKMKKERRPWPYGNYGFFDDPETYAEFLEKFKYKGVGLSGGEPFLVFEKLLAFIKAIRKKLGNQMYLWVYTNGNLVNTSKLKQLKQVGINEIRFNITANNYSVEPVKMAKGVIGKVTVEIPMIPRHFSILKEKILELDKIGIDYLNLHQFYATEFNYNKLSRQGYRFYKFPEIDSAPFSLDSDIAFLRLMRFVLDRGVGIPINYCLACYKRSLQGRGHRVKKAQFLLKSNEDLTEAGYIRKIKRNTEIVYYDSVSTLRGQEEVRLKIANDKSIYLKKKKVFSLKMNLAEANLFKNVFWAKKEPQNAVSSLINSRNSFFKKNRMMQVEEFEKITPYPLWEKFF